MGPELIDSAEEDVPANASSSGTSGEADGGRSRWRFAPFALLVAGGAVCYALGLQRYLTLSALVDHREALSAYVGSYPLRSGLTFFAAYVVAVVFSIPAALVLTITAGFLFGCLLGGVIAIAAASLGASLLFTAARGALSDLLRRRAGRFLERLATGFRRDAFHYLLILRLVPVFPFFIVNIAPAFFDVKLRTFAAATLLGIVPGTFAYAWLGCGLDEVIARAAASGRALSPLDFATRHISLALLALALITALPLVYRRIQSRRREN